MRKVKNVYLFDKKDFEKYVTYGFETGLVLEMEDGTLHAGSTTDVVKTFEVLKIKEDITNE